MARLRGKDCPTDRPPIPDEFRGYDYLRRGSGWATSEEEAAHDAFARTASQVEAEDAWLKLSITAMRRWQRARDAWAEANGYSAHEMYLASQPQVVDRGGALPPKS